MTEREWRAEKIPVMLWYSRHTHNERKRRLIACACARRVLLILDHDPRAVAVVEAVERFADSTGADASAAWRAVLTARREFNTWRRQPRPAGTRVNVSALHALNFLSERQSIRAAEMFDFAQRARRGHQLDPGITEAPAQARIIRDVFGNPFRPVAFAPEWRTDTAVSLARGMYESREFGAMPILADALQDAGCDSADILTHCRDPKQVHVRGCWVVDLVLGKA